MSAWALEKEAGGLDTGILSFDINVFPWFRSW